MKHLCLLFALLLAPGCFISRAYVNQPLEQEQLQRLTPGVTSARQVVEWLGAPADVIQLGKRSAYRYEHQQKKITGLWLLVVGLANEDTQSDLTWVFFDEENVLSHVGSSLQAREAEYAMPWVAHD